MAVEKLGSSALGGAAAGAQIGSVVPGIGTAIGAGIGALGGLAYGAALPGDPVLKMQRKQRRLDKLRGKQKDMRAKGKEGSKRMERLAGKTEDVRDDMSTLRESGDPAMQQYLQMEELANKKVVGLNRAEEVQKLRGTLGGSPTAGQQRLAGTADEMVLPDEAAMTAQLYGAVSQADQMAAAEQEGQRAAATAALPGLVGEAQAQAQAEGQQFMQTASALGGMAKQGILEEKYRKAVDPARVTAISTTPGEKGYGQATLKDGTTIAIRPPDLTEAQLADPTMVEQYNQAVEAAKAQERTNATYQQSLGMMLGYYRPTSRGS